MDGRQHGWAATMRQAVTFRDTRRGSTQLAGSQKTLAFRRFTAYLRGHRCEVGVSFAARLVGHSQQESWQQTSGLAAIDVERTEREGSRNAEGLQFGQCVEHGAVGEDGVRRRIFGRCAADLGSC